MTSKLTRERVVALIAEHSYDSALVDALEHLLAAMDSEPVAYMYRQVQELRNRFGTCDEWEINCRFVESDFPAVEIPESEDYEFLPLYRHEQPAPVVPEEMTAIVKDEAEYVECWNACRAAMLQASPVCACPSGDGSLRWPFPAHPGNSPAIQDGYVMVPKEPTEEMLQASYREAAVYSPTAYRAMIAAAQQELKK